MRRLSLVSAGCLAVLGACASGSQTRAVSPGQGGTESGVRAGAGEGEPSGAEQRWRYTVAVDEELSTLALGLCIEGPRPKRLAAKEGSIRFVRSARVRGGPKLERDGEGLKIESLGETGCVDLDIDLAALTRGGGRDNMRRGDGVMASPLNWLWHPARVPRELDAQARLELPEGVHATLPWPRVQAGAETERVLNGSVFRWNAWAAFGRRAPLSFEAAQCEFEVAVIGDGAGDGVGDGLGDADLEAWISVAAETAATLYGRFPRERVSVVVLPWSSGGRRRAPVLFGVARRGGGASAMLMVDPQADPDVLVGEWVAVHEFLHFTMPLTGDSWMAEGFVTYYTEILRGRLGVFGSSEDRADGDEQARRALNNLASGLVSARRSSRTLAESSDNMRRHGGYNRVYWGGAAVALELDMALREASGGARSLDDLMIATNSLVEADLYWTAEALFARFDQLTAEWAKDEAWPMEISPSEIMNKHLNSRTIDRDLLALEGLAVIVDDGEVDLRATPVEQLLTREALFENPRDSPNSQVHRQSD